VKIVINACYGGFSLSAEATEALARRKGVERLYWFESKPKADYSGFEYTPVELSELGDHRPFMKMAYTTPDRQDDSYWGDRPADRDDPDLVAVVEELGDAANGSYADLRVVEVPDGTDWEINEYDGVEWVAETHRTWR
jgi:hypothetical protein